VLVRQRAAQNATWGFGLARSHEVSSLQSLFAELCELISKATGTTFTPNHALTYRELADALRRGEVGIAWMPPIPAIELQDQGACTALVLPSRGGQTSYHAAIIVRRGGPKTLAELKGRRIAWVHRDSASGYLVPRLHLSSLGYEVLHFFSREIFVGSHIAAIDALVGGQVDATVTFCSLDGAGRVVTAGWTAADGSNVRPVEVIATIGPIPNDAVVASTLLPASVRSAVTRWLLALEERPRQILAELLHAGDFRVASPTHYESLRHTVRAARARGVDSLPPAR
jgi:phosphate/phosphite/phosphonate ABC transporter binding protein